VIGFSLRFNPIPVVVGAALLSGLLAGMSVPALLALLGRSFVSSRLLLMFVLTLPVLGLLEHAGLREHAHRWMSQLRGLTLARLLIGYLLVRQLLSALGIGGVAGAAQTVRPLLAPMGEAAVANLLPDMSGDDRDELRGIAAATDNIGRFFGEDIFLALGAVLLIQAFYAQHGIQLSPLSIGGWAIPSAVMAFAVQAVRIGLYQRRLQRRAMQRRADLKLRCCASNTPTG
jgi:uncharacterized membrane protein